MRKIRSFKLTTVLYVQDCADRGMRHKKIVNAELRYVAVVEEMNFYSVRHNVALY